MAAGSSHHTSHSASPNPSRHRSARQVKAPDPTIAGVIAPPPVLLAGALAIGLLLHAVIPISFVSDHRTLILLVGATLIAAGAALSASVMRAFRAAKTPV